MNESCHIWIYIYIYIFIYTYIYSCHMNESRHLLMRYVTCDWVMSHMNESCHIWLSHVTYEWVMSHTNDPCHVNESRHFSMKMSRMSESCHIWPSHVTYKWVMSHINESCHIWLSHVTYEWVMSHMNDSCHMDESRHCSMIYDTCKLVESLENLLEIILSVNSERFLSHMSGWCLNMTWFIRDMVWMGFLYHCDMPFIRDNDMNWWCHLWYEWVMSHIWMRMGFLYHCVMPFICDNVIKRWCYVWRSDVTCEWVMSHTWMRMGFLYPLWHAIRM